MLIIRELPHYYKSAGTIFVDLWLALIILDEERQNE
jgi:hypothetical protein